MSVAQRSVSLWRNRDFLLLWGGQMVSDVGSSVSGFAYPLLMLAITCSPAQAGFLSAVHLLAYVLFVLPAGVLVDRLNRKRVMVVCDGGRALALGSVFLTLVLGHLTVAQLYVVGFVEVMLEAFFSTAEIACLPQVVEPEQLPTAMSRVQVSTGVESLVGSPLGGVLYGLRMYVPFLADAVSYVVSAVSLLFIRTPFQQARGEVSRNLWKDLTTGLGWLWRQPVLRFMALMVAGNVFVGAGYGLIVIVIAQGHGASAEVIGLIFGIQGVGSIVGGLVAPFVQRRFSFRKVVLVTMWLFALFWLALAVAPNVWALGVVAAGLGLIIPLINVVNISYRLAVTPDSLQGRVNSVARLIANGMGPLGAAVIGVLLQQYGPVVTTLLCALELAVLAVVASLNAAIRLA